MTSLVIGTKQTYPPTHTHTHARTALMSSVLRREQRSGHQAGEESPAACACTFFFHCYPKEEQAASCLGVGIALGSYFSYPEAARDGCPTKIA